MSEHPGDYIWPWQRACQGEINTSAQHFFKGIDALLVPEVYLIGIIDPEKKEEPDIAHIIVEPEGGEFEAKDLVGLEELASQFVKVDAESRVEIYDRHFHLMHLENVEADAFIAAIRKKLDFTDLGIRHEYSVSKPVLIANHRVFVVLKLPKSIVYSHHLLRKTRLSHLLRVSRSFLESAIEVFLEECRDALADVEKTHAFVRTSQDEMFRKAGRHFTRGIGHRLDSIFAQYDLYFSCDKISSLKYEGDEGLGRMILAKENHNNVRLTLKLTDPIMLSDHRKVRKFLEIADRETQIICDGERIFGLGTIKGNYNPTEESLFFVDFLGHFKWSLIHDGHTLLISEYGVPNVTVPKINRAKFHDIVSRVFIDSTKDNVGDLWELTIKAADQKHGTMLVITDHAETESERLRRQSFKLNKVQATPELIHHITSIDGAVMLSPDCQCFAIGVILDGVATPKGDSSRGARFNSAIRYFETNKTGMRIVIIIVSEDGMINIIPDLRPRIRRSDIAQSISKLEKMSKREEPNKKEFAKESSLVTNYEFYLTQQQCDTINKIRALMKSKFGDEQFSWLEMYRVLLPNPEMDGSYFID